MTGKVNNLRRRGFICGALMALAMVFSGNAQSVIPEVLDTIIEIAGEETRVRLYTCHQIHEDGCHAGGKYSLSCSIDNGYYPCLGTVGGGCAISCREGYYSCCGKSCSCKEYPKEEKQQSEKECPSPVLLAILRG